MACFSFCYSFNHLSNEWKKLPRLVSGRTGHTMTVTSQSGAMFAAGGFGYYNFVLNSTEVFEREADESQQKWVAGSKPSTLLLSSRQLASLVQ